MAQYDVFSLGDGSLVLDCQADALSHLNTRLVVALWPPKEAPMAARRLNPYFEVTGQQVVMVTQFAAAVPVAELRTRVTSLADNRYEILGALDILLTGV